MSDARVLHFFGGKGGVGKTTLAAAYAVRLSEDAPKHKVLVVSLDPVQSLSDLLKKKLPTKPTKLQAGKGEGGLWGVELNPAALLKPFLAEYLPALAKAASKGTHLSDEEMGKLYQQAVPGLEELVALFHVAELLEAGEFDRIIVDTAPTSHTLRLFDLPTQLRKFLGFVRAGQDRAPASGGKGKKAEAAASSGGFLEQVGQKAEKLLALLKDPARTAFHLVTLAEPVPEAQTRSYFTQLRERGLPVTEVIVNQVEDHEGCSSCQGRRGLQAPHVRKFQALDKTVPVNLLGRREVAPRGLDGLKEFAAVWSAGKETKALEFSAAEGPPALVRAPSMPPIAAPPLPPTRLIFFVGQGGVGKSSCAAAAAVTLTEKEGPVLLISTDPAHSLSDVLQSRLTDTETQVKGTKGLYARELDMAGWFNALRKRLKEKAEKAFEGAPKAGNDVPADLLYLRNLLECAPPGIDELAAMSVLTDALVQERFKRIVVDSSPVVMSVRVVELADTAKTWLGALHAVLNKHRAKGLADLADDVAGMIKHVKRFEDALASPSESRFVVVTRGEELAASRTERLVEYLKERKLQVERVLVNRVGPKSTCEKCENRRKLELNAAKAIEKKIGLPVTMAPALGRHPAGLRELKAFRTAWYALSAPPAKIKAA
ncbi:TRC40/GET3/ArsA family transport-energizing ATPase [Corallococcus sp. ZKHCc1 1396]|uniref:arsenite-transporting ATPase n=1 Tax=Corallococcus soli TaxID=2710757 RepID=A0ABR9PN06_9BACT|nr:MULTISPECIES: ArsA family ATPase [Corallococcus]MBE4749303.1 TRC40/GET3/ArsA family transport-energizing ATPase [Corallococcus soli]MCY1034909.1 ArsA family ATPase [Corallococcus sp. BB11-1]